MNKKELFKKHASEKLNESVDVFFKAWKWTVIISAVLTVLVTIILSITSYFDIFMLIVSPINGVFIGAHLGVVTGLLAVIKRLVGVAAILPFLIMPLSLILFLWLGSDQIGYTARELFDQVKEVPLPPVHGPGIILAVIMAFILIVFTIFHVAFWKLLFFLLLYTSLGLIVGILLSLPPILVTIFIAASKIIAHTKQKSETAG